MGKHHEIIKRLGIEIPAEIVDYETGETLPADPAKVSRALRIIDEVQHDIKRLARLVKEFFDEKLYLYLGLTKTEAGEVCFGMSHNSIRQLERIAETYGDSIDDFAHIGVTRMDEIAKLPEELKKQLLESKKITFEDGTVITLEDIENMRVRELQMQIKKLMKKNSDLKVNIDELEKNEADYEHRLKILQDENDDLNKMIDIPPDERQFHKKISRLGDVKRKLVEAQNAFYAAFMNLYQIDIDENNRDAVVAGIKGLITTVVESVSELESRFDVSLAPQKNRILELVE